VREIDAALRMVTYGLEPLLLQAERARLMGDELAAARWGEKIEAELDFEPYEGSVAADFRDQHGHEPTEEELPGLLERARRDWDARLLGREVVQRFRDTHDGRDPSDDELVMLVRAVRAAKLAEDEVTDDAPDASEDDVEAAVEGDEDGDLTPREVAARDKKQKVLLAEYVGYYRANHHGEEPSAEALTLLEERAREDAGVRTGRQELLGGVAAHVDVAPCAPMQLAKSPPPDDAARVDRTTARMRVGDDAGSAFVAERAVQKRGRPGPVYSVDRTTGERTLAAGREPKAERVHRSNLARRQDEQGEHQERVMAVVREAHPAYVTKSALGERTVLSPVPLARAIQRLLAAGAIEETRVGREKRYAIPTAR
jgi:hypothetical protein